MKNNMILIITVIFFLNTINGQTITKKNQVKFSDFNDYELVVDDMTFPQPFYIIDSLLADIIKTCSLNLNNDDSGLRNFHINSELINNIAYAKILSHYFEEELFGKYIEKLNNYRTPFIVGDVKTKLNNQLNISRPGILIGEVIKKNIYEKPFPIPLLVENRFILIVKPQNKELKYIDEELKIMQALHYNCSVQDDILGNYTGLDHIQLVTNYLTKGVIEMEVGKKYLVLLSMSYDSKDRGSIYMVRGWTTDGEGIFEVNENDIIDNNHAFSSNNVIQVQDLKDLLYKNIFENIEGSDE